MNTDVERYLRVLQDIGIVPNHQWTVREFGPLEIQALVPANGAHPWSDRVRPTPRTHTGGCVLAPEGQGIFNSSFPYGVNDGALWAGRGLTTALQGGVIGHAGPLSVTVEPSVFRAENRPFSLVPTGLPGRLQFADGFNPTEIDQPQRFGNGPYQRFDPGQTTVRLDFPVIALGVSTANQQWGPAIDNPIILGNNAAGFPNAFIGTSAPVDLYIATLSGRVEWGVLNQSDFAVLQGTESRRFMSGLVASITPRGVPNLEIGGSRFFHVLWPDSGLTSRDFLRPFEGLLLSSLGNAQGADNQLASLFARWVFPRDGIELYAEYGREDNNLDTRDLVLEPDHDAAYVIGLQKAWMRRDSSVYAFHAEIVNSRITQLALGRLQTVFYVHTVAVQGHTEEGQILGSPAVYGGGGFAFEVDRYDRSGEWTLAWNKIGRGEALSSDGLPNALAADAMQSITVRRLMFRRAFDLTSEITVTDDLNRNFLGDAGNVRLSVGVRPHW